MLIHGTWFVSEVDAAGTYLLEGVPAGDYRISVERPGYEKAYTALLTVVEGGEITAPTVTLETPLKPEGAISLNEGAEYSASRTVLVSSSQERAAAEIMLSENPAFTDALWQEISESVEYTFGVDGIVTLYAKFRKLGQYEMTPVSDEITVESIAPQGTLAIKNIGAYAGSRDVTLLVSAKEGSDIKEMMISDDPEMTKGAWEPYAASRAWQLTEGDGEKTIYAKFKDDVGNVSPLVSVTTTLDTTRPTDPVISNIPRRVAAAITSEKIVISTPSTDAHFKSYQARGGAYANWTDVSDPIIFSLPVSDSWYTLEIRGVDLVGNTSSSAKIRLFRGARSVLSGDATAYTQESSRNASSSEVTLRSTYSPYLLKDKGTSTTFVDYNLAIEAGCDLQVDADIAVNLTGLKVNGTADRCLWRRSDASLNFLAQLFSLI